MSEVLDYLTDADLNKLKQPEEVPFTTQMLSALQTDITNKAVGGKILDYLTDDQLKTFTEPTIKAAPSPQKSLMRKALEGINSVTNYVGLGNVFSFEEKQPSDYKAVLALSKARKEGIPVYKAYESVSEEEDKKPMHVYDQFVSNFIDAYTLGLLDSYKKATEGEGLVKPTTSTAGKIASGVGQLLGFIAVPAKISEKMLSAGAGRIGFLRKFLESQSTKFIPKIIGQASKEALSLAPAFALSSTGRALEQTKVGDAAKMIGKGFESGAITGMIFGGARGLFPNDNIASRVARIATGLFALNVQRAIEDPEHRTILNEPVGKAVYDILLNAYFLWYGMPNEVKPDDVINKSIPVDVAVESNNKSKEQKLEEIENKINEKLQEKGIQIDPQAQDEAIKTIQAIEPRDENPIKQAHDEMSTEFVDKVLTKIDKGNKPEKTQQTEEVTGAMSDAVQSILSLKAFEENKPPDYKSEGQKKILIKAIVKAIDDPEFKPYEGSLTATFNKAKDKLIKDGKIKPDEIYSTKGKIYKTEKGIKKRLQDLGVEGDYNIIATPDGKGFIARRSDLVSKENVSPLPEEKPQKEVQTNAIENQKTGKIHEGMPEPQISEATPARGEEMPATESGKGVRGGGQKKKAAEVTPQKEEKTLELPKEELRQENATTKKIKGKEKKIKIYVPKENIDSSKFNGKPLKNKDVPDTLYYVTVDKNNDVAKTGLATVEHTRKDGIGNYNDKINNVGLTDSIEDTKRIADNAKLIAALKDKPSTEVYKILMAKAKKEGIKPSDLAKANEGEGYTPMQLLYKYFSDESATFGLPLPTFDAGTLHEVFKDAKPKDVKIFKVSKRDIPKGALVTNVSAADNVISKRYGNSEYKVHSDVPVSEEVKIENPLPEYKPSAIKESTKEPITKKESQKQEKVPEKKIKAGEKAEKQKKQAKEKIVLESKAKEEKKEKNVSANITSKNIKKIYKEITPEEFIKKTIEEKISILKAYDESINDINDKLKQKISNKRAQKLKLERKALINKSNELYGILKKDKDIAFHYVPKEKKENGEPLPLKIIEEKVKNFAKKFPDLKFTIGKEIDPDNKDSIATFYPFKKEVVIHSPKVDSIKTLEETLLHETIGHYGLTKTVKMTKYGKQVWDDIAQYILKNDAKTLADILVKYKYSFKNDAEKGKAIEEWIARKVEQKSLPQRIMDRLVLWARGFARKMGFRVPFSYREVRAMLYDYFKGKERTFHRLFGEREYEIPHMIPTVKYEKLKPYIEKFMAKEGVEKDFFVNYKISFGDDANKMKDAHDDLVERLKDYSKEYEKEYGKEEKGGLSDIVFLPKHTPKALVDSVISKWKDVKNDIFSIFIPEIVHPEAKKTAVIAREYIRKMTKANAVYNRMLQNKIDWWYKVPERARLEFIYSIDEDNPDIIKEMVGADAGIDPKDMTENQRKMYQILQEQRKEISKIFDDIYEKEQKAGIDYNYRNSYITYLFDDPASVLDLARREIKSIGKERFAKMRTTDSLRYMVDEYGLKLKTTNPYEILLIRALSAEHNIAKMEFLREMQKYGLVKEYKRGSTFSENFRSIITDKKGDQYLTSPVVYSMYQMLRSDDPAKADEFLRKSIAEKIVKKYTPSSLHIGETVFSAPDNHNYVIRKEAWDVLETTPILPEYRQKGLWNAPGVVGKFWRAFMGLKNAVVLLKLGFSGFHTIFITTIKNSATTSALLEDILKNPKDYTPWEAITKIAKAQSGYDIIKHYKLGKLYRDAYSMPEEEFNKLPSYQKVAVKLITESGLDPEMSLEWQTRAKELLRKAIERKSKAGIIYHGFQKLMESTTAYLFKHYIPNMKTSAFVDEALKVLRRNPELLDQPLKRKLVLQKIAASVDNRFGMLAYDQLFMDKVVKDLAIGSSLAFGWRFGFFREYGGAVKDTGVAVKNLITGKFDFNKDITRRMIFVTHFTLQHMLLGALITYLFTGKAPKKLMDYFMPDTGRRDEHGDEIRLNLPSYTREIPSIVEHLRKEGLIGGIFKKLVDGANPLITEAYRMWSNEDYFGGEIVNPHDPIYKQLADYITYFIGEAKPISFDSFIRLKRVYPAFEAFLVSAAGLTKAPRYITETTIQKLIRDEYDRVAKKHLPKEDIAKNNAKREIRMYIIKNRKIPKDKLLDAIRKGYFGFSSKREIIGNLKRFMRSIRYLSDQRMFKGLPTKSQIYILETAWDKGYKKDFKRYFSIANKNVKIYILRYIKNVKKH